MIHSALHFFFNVIIIFMDIFQLICFINIITYDYSKFEIIDYFFVNNWSNNLIKKINIEYQNNNNNIDDEWESPINVTFPGIIAGCDCSSYNGMIYDDKCVTSLLVENCENIYPIDRQNFNILYLPDSNDYSNRGIKITIERFNDFTYYDLLNNSENNKNYFIDNSKDKCECPKYSEVCFDCGVIDSIGNHLCITSYNGLKYDCFKLKLEYDFSLKDTKLIKDFEQIFIQDKINTKYLQYPIEFINIFNNKTCILQDESITSPLAEYKLIYIYNDTTLFINGPKNQGCNTNLLYDVKYDNRWINIYTFPLDYILDNQFKKQLRSLPEFPYEEYIQKNFSLAYRTYIGFGKHCIGDIQFITNIIPSFHKNIKIKFIVFLFCALVIFPYYLLLIMVIAQTELLTFFQSFILGSSYSVIISIFMRFLLLEYDNTIEKYGILNQIANKFCGDILTNNLFFSLLNDYQNIKNSIRYSIYWTIVMLNISVLKIILIITKGYKKRIMYTLNNGNQNPTGNHNYNLITEVETQLLN